MRIAMSFEELLQRLSDHAANVEASEVWPTSQMNWLADAGVLKWGIPPEFQGTEPSPRDFLDGYRRLAAACLTTCFILTQRNAACRRIVDSENATLRERLLPRLVTGELFATVGISHLTTSRQHLACPAVRVEIDGTSVRLTGSIPWVTGAKAADWIVTGGTVDDGRQVLVAVPTATAGVSVEESVRLMALTASQTAAVVLDNVTVPLECLLAGPVSGVMQQGDTSGTGSLTTSALALGLCDRALALIREQSAFRSELSPILTGFAAEYTELERDLFASSDSSGRDPQLTPTAIRRRANSLVIRVTQAALAISKGAGFIQGHPAERAVREAMFFLVWSCPQPVVLGVLEEWACRDGFSSMTSRNLL